MDYDFQKINYFLFCIFKYTDTYYGRFRIFIGGVDFSKKKLFTQL